MQNLADYPYHQWRRPDELTRCIHRRSGRILQTDQSPDRVAGKVGQSAQSDCPLETQSHEQCAQQSQKTNLCELPHCHGRRYVSDQHAQLIFKERSGLHKVNLVDHRDRQAGSHQHSKRLAGQ